MWKTAKQFMDGKKTLSGILVVVFAMLGFLTDQMDATASASVAVTGASFAFYGAMKKFEKFRFVVEALIAALAAQKEEK